MTTPRSLKHSHLGALAFHKNKRGICLFTPFLHVGTSHVHVFPVMHFGMLKVAFLNKKELVRRCFHGSHWLSMSVHPVCAMASFVNFSLSPSTRLFLSIQLSCRLTCVHTHSFQPTSTVVSKLSTCHPSPTFLCVVKYATNERLYNRWKLQNREMAKRNVNARILKCHPYCWNTSQLQSQHLKQQPQ